MSLASRAVALVMRVLVVVVLSAAIATGAGIRLKKNWSGSIPMGWWLQTPVWTRLQRGDTVAVELRGSLARLGAGRGYDAGDGVTAYPLAKVVGALAGDTVTIAPAGVLVNGHRLPNSERVLRDPSGRKIPSVPFGRYRVAPGTMWIFGSARGSWDSRYFGPVPTTEVVGVLFPLWTEQEGSGGYQTLLQTTRET